MPRLSHRDFDHLSRFLLDLYQLRDHPTFMAHVISALHDLIPCDRVSYNELDFHRSRAFFEWSHDPLDWRPRIQSKFEQLIPQHPHVRHVRSTSEFHEAHITDFTLQKSLNRLPLFQEVYRPLHTKSQLTTVLEYREPLMTPIALSRETGTFRERERSLLTLLRPHLAQALANARRVTQINEQTALLGQALEATGCAAIRLAPSGCVIESTTHATFLLDRYCPGERYSDLPTVILDCLAAERRSDGTSSAPHFPHALTFENEHGRLTVRLLRGSEVWWLLLEERRQDDPLPRLKAAGLTEREAEVLTWVMKGKSYQEVATILGNKPATVKKHLERIYVKLGVDNRSAAVARLQEIEEPEY